MGVMHVLCVLEWMHVSSDLISVALSFFFLLFLSSSTVSKKETEEKKRHP